MLKRLSVKNFAIIEDITVSFQDGMTVLTGETGAGKSLIIDTISLLLGAKADRDMIRYQESMASVEGVLDCPKGIEDILIHYNIPCFKEIVILREIYDSSKNVVKINQQNVSLAVLKNIAVYLADIHIQNDTYRLFQPENSLELIDPKEDLKFEKLKTDYSKKLFSFKESFQEYKHIISGQKTALEKLEFLKYEQEELTSLNLRENIDVELEEQIAKLSNYDKISSGLQESYQALENEIDPLEQIYKSGKSLDQIKNYDETYRQNSEKLMDCYYILSEIKEDIGKQLYSLDYNEEEFNQFIAQANEIEKAKEKYKKSVKELIQYLKEISLEIEMTTNYDEILKEKEKECQNRFTALVESANKLTEYRKTIAVKLEKGIIEECKDLDLEHIRFEIHFEEVSCHSFSEADCFTEEGWDIVTLWVSFNKGEPLRPLYKVASGGEMSRMMLAFKSYLSKHLSSTVIIFDEIDTGVSGVTAKKIARKMYDISRNTQVLCITHLPQVAAMGDYHKHIYKLEENGRTRTQITDLTEEKRIEEIALMLSGDKLSYYALEHAKALLKEEKRLLETV